MGNDSVKAKQINVEIIVLQMEMCSDRFINIIISSVIQLRSFQKNPSFRDLELCHLLITVTIK